MPSVGCLKIPGVGIYEPDQGSKPTAFEGDEHMIEPMSPVFYDFEASGLHGVAIEIGWAFVDPATKSVVSESHLIKPSDISELEKAWDPIAEDLHGITLSTVTKDGRPAFEIAKRMNSVLRGRELFADSPFDETWLMQVFDAAGLEPEFHIRKYLADLYIQERSAQLGILTATFARLQETANRLSPQTHRAEPDARHWATLWLLVSQSAGTSN